MTTVVTQLLSALCGSFGFALLFNHKGLNLLFAALGGGLTWGLYLFCENFSENLFLLNLLAAAFAAVYSEVLARLRKTPATAFMVTSIIPLVPGGSLYYTLLYILADDKAAAQTSGVNTLFIAGGVAVGIVLVSVLLKPLTKKKRPQ